MLPSNLKEEINLLEEVSLNEMSNTQLALSFQRGKTDAGNLLLENFNNLVKLFTNVLFFGNYIRKPMVKEFLKLVVSRSKLNDEKKIQKILNVISSKYSHGYDEEDMAQDIKIAILETAQKYDICKVEREFEYFFKIYFKYLLKKNVVDPLDSPVIMDCNEYFHIKQNEDLNENNIADLYEISNEKLKFEGDFKDERLQKLNYEEKLLLKRYYIDDMTLKELSNKHYEIGYSQLSRKIKKIRQKLKNK